MVSNIDSGVKTTERKYKRRGFSPWALGAIFGLTGGFIFPIFGALILNALGRGARISPFLQNFALVLAVSTIPLLAIGIYCLNAAVERALPRRKYSGSRRQIPARWKPGEAQADAPDGRKNLVSGKEKQ